MRELNKKQRNATYGVCVECEKIFKHGEYTWADGLIFCESCRAAYDADTTPGKQRKYN